MRAMSIAAIATALIVTAAIPAAAADQIITEPFTLTIPSSVVPDEQTAAEFDSSPFPLFAPTTGTLESVNITLMGVVSVASLLSDPFVVISFHGAGGEFIGDLATIHQPGMTNLNFSGPGKTSSYIGNGNGIGFVVLFNLAGPNTSLIESIGPSLNGLVSYTYMLPTLAVPETPTWAAMLVGFAGLGFMGYRRARGRGATTGASGRPVFRARRAGWDQSGPK